MRLPGCETDLALPEMGVTEAVAGGARTFVIRVANASWVPPKAWIPYVVEAIGTGMDVVSGLHVRLESVPAVAEAAGAAGAALHDLRHPTRSFATGKGHKRTGRRLLAVGTDCSVARSAPRSASSATCAPPASTPTSAPRGRRGS